MRRYWVPEAFIQEDMVNFTGDILHHVRDVCRLDVGAKFEVLTDSGMAHFVEMTEVGKKFALAKVLEKRSLPPLPLPYIKLAISLPRYNKMDLIVEKAVELGVHSIHPFVSDFSFIRQASNLSASKIQRWSKIVQGATQQSGRGDRMPIHGVKGIKEILEGINQDPHAKGLFLYEGDCDRTFKKALSEIKPFCQAGDLTEIWLVIGSEGGFSQKEVELMMENHLEPITLGEQILRVETACVAAVSMARIMLLME